MDKKREFVQKDKLKKEETGSLTERTYDWVEGGV